MTAPPAQSSKRLLSEAIYEQLMTDEDAPPSVRLEAAKAYDAIENGRPGIARPVSVDDISSLDDDQCERLFHALMRRFDTNQPGFHTKIIQQIVDQMLAQQAALPALPPPNRFRRGPFAGKGPEVPRWPPAPSQKGESPPSNAKVEPAAYAYASPPASRDRQAAPPAASDHYDRNVVSLPGTTRVHVHNLRRIE